MNNLFIIHIFIALIAFSAGFYINLFSSSFQNYTTNTKNYVRPINLLELENNADTIIPAISTPGAWGYISGGSDDEITLKDNLDAFSRIKLKPRILVNVSHIDTSTTVLGYPIKFPVMVAPAAANKLTGRQEGELGTVSATTDIGSIMVVSSFTSIPYREIIDIAKSKNSPIFFQLYINPNRTKTEIAIRKAEKAGFDALILTVDVPRHGNREREVRYKFLSQQFTSQNISSGNSHKQHDWRSLMRKMLDDSVQWSDIEWIRNITSLPIIIKGIQSPEDAKIACYQYNIPAIIVSNHGGRQLDTLPATIEVLPHITKAVDGKCEVYIDGGIRRGTHVLKALAYGARAVLVGRPILYGLGLGGKQGVYDVLDILYQELELSMALSGVTKISDISQDLIWVNKLYN